ncbi:acyltransferase family protein [Roseobacter ponti]|uniref:acyltransferase family protein n=1 Tax=Roseobacter ponti TaxID=1891787 RepID=UPI003CCD923E
MLRVEWQPGADPAFWAGFAFSEHTPHPSFFILFPVLGSVLIIGFANPKYPAVRLLSARPHVGVGSISCSLYLWHFPVFAFLRVWNFGINDPFLISIGIVLSCVLAAVTWKWVKQPFRNKTPCQSGGLPFWR